MPNGKLTVHHVREPRAQNPFQAGQRRAPVSQPVLAHDDSLKRSIALLELICDQAIKGYVDAVRKDALWRLEHPNFDPAKRPQVNLPEAQEYDQKAAAVSYTKGLALVAVTNLQPYRIHFAKEISFYYKHARQQASRLDEELIYAPAWERDRERETRARYQAFRELQTLLEPFHVQASVSVPSYAAPYFRVTCHWCMLTSLL